VAGDVSIRDSWVERPSAVSTFFNPFADNVYDFDGDAPYEYDDYNPFTPDEDFVPSSETQPGGGGQTGQEEYSGAISQPATTPAPTTPPATPEPTTPPQTFPFTTVSPDRPGITWPDDTRP